MVELSSEEVMALARSVNLPISEDDLLDVTHRLNAMLEGIETIDHPALDEVVPYPIVLPEKGNG